MLAITKCNPTLSNDELKYYVPEFWPTNLVLTSNIRELRHILKLRTAPAALKEFRYLARAMYEAVPEEYKYLLRDSYIRRQAMSRFTSGNWHEMREGIVVRSNETDTPIAILVQRSNDIDMANARLIAAAPEMYDWIETTCRFLHDLKRYAQDEDEMRAHAEDMNTTYNDLLCKAYLMLGHIDGEEASDA